MKKSQLKTGTNKPVIEVKLTHTGKVSFKIQRSMMIAFEVWFDAELLTLISCTADNCDRLMCAVLLDYQTFLRRTCIRKTYTLNRATAISLFMLMNDCYELPLQLTEFKESLRKLVIN